MTDDEKSISELALDTFVYAPLGLLLEARDLVPKMIERGRGQVTLARLAGTVAAQQGRAEASRRVDSSTSREESTDTSSFPIDGYDQLKAATIVPMLDALDAEQLAAVLDHEQSHRSRATVINRIAKLQG